MMLRISALSPPVRAVVSILVCAFAFGLDQTELQLGGALSTIFSAAPYALDPYRLSWLVGAAYIGGFVGAPLLGRMADSAGLRRVLCWTLVWLGITSILAGARDDPGWLTVFRLLAGVSMCAYPPLMIAYLTSIAPEGQRGKWIFWACGLASLAPPAALFALRALTHLHPGGVAGWRWLLLAAGGWALIAGGLFKSLTEPRRSRRDAPGSPHIGAVGLLLKGPARRTFVMVAALYSLQPWATAAFVLLMGPILLQRGLTLTNALWYVSFATAWPAVGTLAAAWVVDRIPSRVALLSCCVIMLFGTLVFAVGTTTLSLGVALVAFGIGSALYTPVMMTLGAASFPADLRATATTVAWALNRLGTCLVPVALLPLMKLSGPPGVWLSIGSALVLSALVTLIFRPAPIRGRIPIALASNGT